MGIGIAIVVTAAIAVIIVCGMLAMWLESRQAKEIRKHRRDRGEEGFGTLGVLFCLCIIGAYIGARGCGLVA